MDAASLRNETVDLVVNNAEWSGDQGEVQVTRAQQGRTQVPFWIPSPDAHGLKWSPTKTGTRFGTAASGSRGFLVGVDEGGLSTYEPHYTDIVEEDEVQVYELVAVDVTGTPTNVLERAAGSAKDNRLLPVGFTHEHAVYDTTRVEGLALEDEDFVLQSAQGLDRVHYAMTATLKRAPT